MPLTLEQEWLMGFHSGDSLDCGAGAAQAHRLLCCRKVPQLCSPRVFLFSGDLLIPYTYFGEVQICSLGCGLCWCPREKASPQAPVSPLSVHRLLPALVEAGAQRGPGGLLPYPEWDAHFIHRHIAEVLCALHHPPAVIFSSPLSSPARRGEFCRGWH